MFCIQIHARTYFTMNEKFYNTALSEAECSISSSWYIKQVCEFGTETKQELSVSNLFNIQLKFTAGDRLKWLPARPV